MLLAFYLVSVVEIGFSGRICTFGCYLESKYFLSLLACAAAVPVCSGSSAGQTPVQPLELLIHLSVR